MTEAQTIAFLREFNRWRRGDDSIPQPQPGKASEAIDAVCTYAEQLNESNAVLLADLRHYREMAEDLERQLRKARDAVHQLRKQRAIARAFGEQLATKFVTAT